MWNSTNMRIILDDTGLEANIPNPRQAAAQNLNSSKTHNKITVCTIFA
jgi:hypothetical protein